MATKQDSNNWQDSFISTKIEMLLKLTCHIIGECLQTMHENLNLA